MNLFHNAVFASIFSLGLCFNDPCSANSTLSNVSQLASFSIVNSQDQIQLSPSPSSAMVTFQRQRGGQQQRAGSGAGRGPKSGGGVQQQTRGPQRGGQLRNRQQGGGQTNGRAGMNADQVAGTMMQNFDADGDGTLNLQELTDGLRSLEQSMRQLQSQGRLTQDGEQCQPSRRGLEPATAGDAAAASENFRRRGPRSGGGPRGGQGRR